MKKIIDFLKSDRFYLFGLIFSYICKVSILLVFLYYLAGFFFDNYGLCDYERISGTFQEGCEYSVCIFCSFILVVLFLRFTYFFVRDLVNFIRLYKKEKEKRNL